MVAGDHAEGFDPISGSGATGGSLWVLIGPLDVAEGDAVHVEIGGYELCVARSSGRLYALRDECSHGQVRLSEGDVGEGFVECWMHGSCFDLETGVSAGPPAVESVEAFPLRLEGSDVEVMLPAPA